MQPNFVLQRGGAPHSAFSFARVKEKIVKVTKSSENKVESNIQKMAHILMAPINGNAEQLVHHGPDRPKKISFGEIAKRVARKTSLIGGAAPIIVKRQTGNHIRFHSLLGIPQSG